MRIAVKLSVPRTSRALRLKQCFSTRQPGTNRPKVCAATNTRQIDFELGSGPRMSADY